MSAAIRAMHPSKRRRRQAGFGLLEAIVALTLLASTGAVLFSWLNHNLETLARLRERDERSRLLLNAQALAATIDPLRQPDGTLDAAGLRLSWRSEVRQPLTARALAEAGTGQQWRIGLYRLQVRAERLLNPAQAVSFEMLQPGMQAPAAPAVAGAKP